MSCIPCCPCHCDVAAFNGESLLHPSCFHGGGKHGPVSCRGDVGSGLSSFCAASGWEPACSWQSSPREICSMLVGDGILSSGVLAPGRAGGLGLLSLCVPRMPKDSQALFSAAPVASSLQG